MTKTKMARANSDTISVHTKSVLGGMAAFFPLLATGLVTCAATLFLVSAAGSEKPAHPSIAAFDVDAAIARYVAVPDVARLATDDQAFSTAIQSFHAALEAEMARFAQSQAVVLLSANAILAGDAPDVTAALVDRVLSADHSQSEVEN